MDSDERPDSVEPIHVVEFEGEYVRVMEGNLPAIKLQMDEGYARGTHLDLKVRVRVRNVRYDEVTAKENKGDLKRIHVFALEEIELLRALSAEEADPGVGGSAGGGELRIEERFEVEEEARECLYDNVRLEVVHRGGCEKCLDRVQTGVLNLANGVEFSPRSDPGF